jgi:hypothetical protein
VRQVEFNTHSQPLPFQQFLQRLRWIIASEKYTRRKISLGCLGLALGQYLFLFSNQVGDVPLINGLFAALFIVAFLCLQSSLKEDVGGAHQVGAAVVMDDIPTKTKPLKDYKITRLHC